jgi:hypothetical protein
LVQAGLAATETARTARTTITTANPFIDSLVADACKKIGCSCGKKIKQNRKKKPQNKPKIKTRAPGANKAKKNELLCQATLLSLQIGVIVW